MATKSERFKYTSVEGQRGVHIPLLPLCLFGIFQPIEASALLDSGSTLNVLPRTIGIKLGLNWDTSIPLGRISGAYAKSEARGVKIRCQFGTFDAMPLLFAWSENDEVPLVLGQVDFFRQNRICFFESEKAFEITSKT